MHLITGGLGFIGSHLAEALVHAGKSVRILDNRSSGKIENLGAARDSIEIIEGDITDSGACSERSTAWRWCFIKRRWLRCRGAWKRRLLRTRHASPAR